MWSTLQHKQHVTKPVDNSSLKLNFLSPSGSILSQSFTSERRLVWWYALYVGKDSATTPLSVTPAEFSQILTVIVLEVGL